ncbi:hypothetical protein [Gynuella sunshinyii]|uniref:Uncharacterized protein n=1 Tax=Gynuella sunshinyii YC6258 TaxID=1445510 RepID=A0A0C5VT80_9GAMM|nr:hypothetical protein [Gynuella sunshinyii]AJQ93524.1 hypothetical Protein YC6258_01476 [Gynuella sunshinyii YC6258]
MPDVNDYKLERLLQATSENASKDQCDALSDWKRKFYCYKTAYWNFKNIGTRKYQQEFAANAEALITAQGNIDTLLSDIYMTIKDPQEASHQWDRGREKFKRQNQQNALSELTKETNAIYQDVRSALAGYVKHETEVSTNTEEPTMPQQHEDNSTDPEPDASSLDKLQVQKLYEEFQNLKAENQKLKQQLQYYNDDSSHQTETSQAEPIQPKDTPNQETNVSSTTAHGPFYFQTSQDED